MTTHIGPDCSSLDERIRALRVSVLASKQAGDRGRATRKRLHKAIADRHERFGRIVITGESVGGNPAVLIVEDLYPGPERHHIIVTGTAIGTLTMDSGRIVLQNMSGSRTTAFLTEGYHFLQEHEKNYWLRLGSNKIFETWMKSNLVFTRGS